MSSLLAGAAVASLGLPLGSPASAGAASVLAAAVGAFRVALGLLRGGRLIMLIPHTVLDGFVCGACWLVFATQVPVILGAAPPPGMHFLSGAGWLLFRPALWNVGPLLTALGTVVCLFGGKRLHPLFPGAVIATLFGCAACAAGLPIGSTVGAVSAGLPSLLDPRSLPWHLLPQLLSAAVAISIAGVAEAVAISSQFAKEKGQEWQCDRELISQGTANLMSAAFGGFPVAGSLSRTSLGRTAGATSQLAHAITGLTVLAVLPLGAPLLAALPRAVLGGLVASAVWPLLKPSPRLLVTRSLKGQPAEWPVRDLMLGWVTMAVTLAASPRLELGLEAGLALAVALALLQAIDHALMTSLQQAAETDRPIFLEAAL
jgi:SulP family sulfate permease